MERIYYSRKDFLEMAGVITGAILTAPNSVIHLTDDSLPLEISQSSPKKDNPSKSGGKSVHKKVEEPVVPSLGIEQKFVFGESKFDFTKPFEVRLSPELGQYLGKGPDGKYHADIPLPLNTNSWDEATDLIAGMNVAGVDNSNGNAYVVANTDIPNLTLNLQHSGIRSSIGEAVRRAGKLLKNGDSKKLMNLNMDIKFEDNDKTLVGSILGVMIMDGEVFSEKNEKGEYTWGRYDIPDTHLFARTDAMDLPKRVRENDPDEFIVGFVSCIAPDGEIHYKRIDWNSKELILDTEKNSLERSIMFVKFDANQ